MPAARSEVFESCHARLPRKLPLKFAAPGAERQDSVASGFAAIAAEAQVRRAARGPVPLPARSACQPRLPREHVPSGPPHTPTPHPPHTHPQLVAIHDSARPLITAADTLQCCADAMEVRWGRSAGGHTRQRTRVRAEPAHTAAARGWAARSRPAHLPAAPAHPSPGPQVGAAVLGVPVKPTIKEVDGDRMVVQTLKRAALWEVQTPQASARARGCVAGCKPWAALARPQTARGLRANRAAAPRRSSGRRCCGRALSWWGARGWR